MWSVNMVSELHRAQAVPPADAPGVRMLSRQLLSWFFPPSLACPCWLVLALRTLGNLRESPTC